MQRAGWLLADNRGILVALAGLAGLVAFCLRRWRLVGRDPAKGVIIPRYEPPAGHGPAGLRYVRRMGYDTRCFSADVLALAVEGQLRIHREKGLLRDGWWLERTASPAAAPSGAAARALLDRLFRGGVDRVDSSRAAPGSSARRGRHTVRRSTPR